LPELAFSLALAIRLGTGTREISERSGFQWTWDAQTRAVSHTPKARA
jgi:hypothetical protein